MEKIKRKGNHTTHGQRDSKIYTVWANIKQRCFNENVPCYKYYGGKGVTMCGEWANDFKVFYDWMMINGWRIGLEIDRIDNSKNYCPENCRLVTHKENMLNQDSVIKIKRGGKDYSLLDYCLTFGLVYGRVKQRISKLGWPIEKAIQPDKYNRGGKIN
jgi:hypothetical protein